MTPRASHGNTLPAITTSASATVSTTSCVEVGTGEQQPDGEEDGTDDDRRQHQRAALARGRSGRPGRPPARRHRRGHRVAEEVALGRWRTSARRPRRTPRPIQATATAASGSCWARESTIAPTTRAAAIVAAAVAASGRAGLDVERDRAERHQQARGAQGGTTRGRGLPGLEVVLDDVGHRLDDVVVDPRRLVVDAGGHGDARRRPRRPAGSGRSRWRAARPSAVTTR